MMTRRLVLLLALSLLGLAWFGTLDYRKLIKPDEGRYAEIAREMAQSGDFVTPRLNGIKYFEKPPLQYWATAASFRLFGEHDWSARLWPALTGFLGILFTWFTARRLFGAPVALPAAAILASSLLYLAVGHINTLDMGLSFFVTVALFAFLHGQRCHEGPLWHRSQAHRWFWLVWSALALAVLSKGLVALVLTGASLVAYTLLERDFAPWRRLQWHHGPLLFLVIAAPWFIAVSLANPGFAHFFFIHEHFERFLTTVHRRDHPAWYFVPILLIGLLPWTTMALQALANAWSADRQTEGFRTRRFLLLWCLIVFLFFSASSSKLPSYILPIFPALALLTGEWLVRASTRGLRLHLIVVSCAALAALTLAPRVVLRADEETPLAMMQTYADWLTVGAALWLAGSLIALGLLRRNRTLALGALAAGGFLAGNCVLLGHESLAHSNSSYHLARKIAPQLAAPELPFYSVGYYEQTFPYYLRRTVTLVDYQDEFAFGLTMEPHLAIATLDEFIDRWLHDADAFAIMTPHTFDRLSKRGLPMTVVARDTRRIVVRKLAGTILPAGASGASR